jgi:hypothetical protein
MSTTRIQLGQLKSMVNTLDEQFACPNWICAVDILVAPKFQIHISNIQWKVVQTAIPKEKDRFFVLLRYSV